MSGSLQIDPAHKWNFSQTLFWQNQNKKVNKGASNEREQAKIVYVKKEIQNSLGKVPGVNL